MEEVMIKLKATKKAIKNSGKRIYSVGYCEAQNLLNYKSAFAYSCSNVSGWDCDYYELSDNIIVSTGYSPIGIPATALFREYDQKAREIRSTYAVDVKEKIDMLIIELVVELDQINENSKEVK